ncbi:MAG: hypothetical protein HYS08_02215 [Chlamydiae bacterium]|nr:hypothetical protein [Chlamydiota bacterium]MBI3266690.1 hypothetical protein [Chlamydiota bacterium]
MLEIIFLGLACMSAPLFAKYAGFEHKKLAFDMVGLSGMFFLLGSAFMLVSSKLEMFSGLGHYGMLFSYFVGLLGMVIGALLAGLDLLMEFFMHPEKLFQHG